MRIHLKGVCGTVESFLANWMDGFDMRRAQTPEEKTSQSITTSEVEVLKHGPTMQHKSGS